VVGGLTSLLGWLIQRHRQAGLVNRNADLARLAAPHLCLTAASGHRQEKRIEEAQPALLKRTIKDWVVPGESVRNDPFRRHPPFGRARPDREDEIGAFGATTRRSRGSRIKSDRQLNGRHS
jgi:hypothetical protein